MLVVNPNVGLNGNLVQQKLCRVLELHDPWSFYQEDGSGGLEQAGLL